jgi:hypothetical protein
LTLLQTKPLSEFDEDTILENGGLVPHLMQSRFDFKDNKGAIVSIKKREAPTKSKAKRVPE